MSAEQKATALEALKAGASVREAAEEAGTSRSVIYKWRSQL